jgi:hypothetical protein
MADSFLASLIGSSREQQRGTLDGAFSDSGAVDLTFARYRGEFK